MAKLARLEPLPYDDIAVEDSARAPWVSTFPAGLRRRRSVQRFWEVSELTCHLATCALLTAPGLPRLKQYQATGPRGLSRPADFAGKSSSNSARDQGHGLGLRPEWFKGRDVGDGGVLTLWLEPPVRCVNPTARDPEAYGVAAYLLVVSQRKSTANKKRHPRRWWLRDKSCCCTETQPVAALRHEMARANSILLESLSSERVLDVRRGAAARDQSSVWALKRAGKLESVR